MNKAEVMTLLKSKVAPEKIRIAIMAGKISGILQQADRQLDEAREFGENAHWTEMLRIMEGTLSEEKGHRAEKSSNKY